MTAATLPDVDLEALVGDLAPVYKVRRRFIRDQLAGPWEPCIRPADVLLVVHCPAECSRTLPACTPCAEETACATAYCDAHDAPIACEVIR